MRVLLSIFFALWLGSGVLSAPTLKDGKGRSFKVQAVRRSDTVHGPTALRKAYLKYGIVPSNIGIDLEDFEPFEPNVKAAVTDSKAAITEPDQSGAVSAASVEGDAAFVSPITIGGQELVVTFDTGSSDV
jgi:aspergillopepsin I